MTNHPLARWRRGRNLSRWKLAAAIDVSVETLAAVERGYRKPDRILERLVDSGLLTPDAAADLRQAIEGWAAQRRERAQQEVFDHA